MKNHLNFSKITPNTLECHFYLKTFIMTAVAIEIRYPHVDSNECTESTLSLYFGAYV